MKKVILIVIAYTCFALSCTSIPKDIRRAFTYCYTDTYTGIDTLINIEGYYSAGGTMIFYDNGLVVSPIYRYSTDLTPLFLKEIAENPETKKAKSFCNFIDCGSYVICGDTIKVQMIHNYHSMNDYWSGMEKWYKIIDKNLHLLDVFRVTTDKKEKEYWRKIFPISTRVGEKIQFVPVPVKPQPDYFWILKEKWFWCNEQDWKDYMQKIEKKK